MLYDAGRVRSSRATAAGRPSRSQQELVTSAVTSTSPRRASCDTAIRRTGWSAQRSLAKWSVTPLSFLVLFVNDMCMSLMLETRACPAVHNVLTVNNISLSSSWPHHPMYTVWRASGTRVQPRTAPDERAVLHQQHLHRLQGGRESDCERVCCRSQIEIFILSLIRWLYSVHFQILKNYPDNAYSYPILTHSQS